MHNIYYFENIVYKIYIFTNLMFYLFIIIQLTFSVLFTFPYSNCFFIYFLSVFNLNFDVIFFK